MSEKAVWEVKRYQCDHPMLITFIVHTQNRPDALARVVMLFHRLALNIEILTWTRNAEADAARIRITVEAGSHQSLRIQANLNKLIDVLRVEHTNNQSVS